MYEIVFVKPGQEQDFIAMAIQLDQVRLLLVYSEKDFSGLTQEYISTIKSQKNIDVFVGVDLVKDKKYPLADEGLQLGTIKKDLFLNTTILYGNEFEQEKDFIHQRRSGLNQVVLNECTSRNVSVCFAYGELQNSTAARRAQFLGRMMINARLCRKYGVRSFVAGMVANSLLLRHERDVKAFSALLLQ